MVRDIKVSLTPLLFFLWLPLAAAAEHAASLDRGYRFMYNLQFDAAQREFIGTQREHPGDPLGPVSEAANQLFSEFDRLGVLEAQFFVKDASFRSRKKLRPDPKLRARFDAALNRAEALARQRLSEDGENPDSLFALALVHGLRADYAALVEKRSMAALQYTRQASEYGSRLLAVSPSYYDAYLTTGIAKYLVGSMAAPLRWVLQLAGYAADKKQGLKELNLTAENGRFLAPFARILMSIAYLRDDNRAQAREMLLGLRDDFPSNPLFAREIVRLDGGD